MNKIIVLFFIISLINFSCQSQVKYETKEITPYNNILTCSSKKNIVVGITHTSISSKTAKLLFTKNAFQLMLSSAIEKTNCFKIIDAKTISDVISRHLLEESEFETNEGRKKIANLLKADYFLTGDITDLTDDIIYPNSTISKSKKEIVSIRIELYFKNALTNEILFTISSEGRVSKEIIYSHGFGPGGGTDRYLAKQALNLAINNAMKQLIYKIEEMFK